MVGSKMLKSNAVFVGEEFGVAGVSTIFARTFRKVCDHCIYNDSVLPFNMSFGQFAVSCASYELLIHLCTWFEYGLLQLP
jgi:hypothetical protein